MMAEFSFLSELIL